jgi:class 3 adenylate cyclase
MPTRRGRRKKADQATDGDTIGDVVRRTDSNPQLVATARFLRGLIPGGEPETSEMPEAVRRLVEEVQPKGPSAIREIGKGAMQAWQALSEAQRRRRGNADVAILFTDLVGFSDWALQAGDEAALDVLRQVGDAEQKAVSSNKGAVVKRLGDGAMAVFSEAEQAVRAALESQGTVSKIEVEGYRPKQRAGVHRGTPRKVKGDSSASTSTSRLAWVTPPKADEVLVSGIVRDQLDGGPFKFGAESPARCAGGASRPDRQLGQAQARPLTPSMSTEKTEIVRRDPAGRRVGRGHRGLQRGRRGQRRRRAGGPRRSPGRSRRPWLLPARSPRPRGADRGGPAVQHPLGHPVGLRRSCRPPAPAQPRAGGINYLFPDYTHDTFTPVRRSYGATPCWDFLRPIFDDWVASWPPTPMVPLFWNVIRLVMGADSKLDVLGNDRLPFAFIHADGAIEALDVLGVCGADVAATGLTSSAATSPI